MTALCPKAATLISHSFSHSSAKLAAPSLCQLYRTTSFLSSPYAQSASQRSFIHFHRPPQRRPARHATSIHSARCHPPSYRCFTSSPPHLKYKTVEQQKARTASGPFNLRAALLFITAGVIMIVYFRHEKDRMERKKIAELSKGVGRPKVGGPFELKDTEGGEWNEKMLKGGFTLV